MGNAGKVLTSANAPMVLLNILYRIYPEWRTDDYNEQTIFALALTNLLGMLVVMASTAGAWAAAKLASEERTIKGHLSELCLMWLSKLA